MGMLLRRRYDKAELPDELKEKAEKAEDEKEPSEVEETEAEQASVPQEGAEDLDELTVPQLKERLDAAGIEYKANEKKQDLVEKLKGE